MISRGATVTGGAMQLALDFGGSARGGVTGTAPRREPREAVVRLVEYAPFPRVRADQRRAVGFTHDLSASGMCLGATEALPVGSLLHVVVRCVDGRPTLDSLAEVTWCCPSDEGDVLLGLRLVSERPAPRLVRRPPPPATRAVA